MATAYLSPGVYMEEVSSGSKPIEGVGTAVAAFVGFAETGPVGQPTRAANTQPERMPPANPNRNTSTAIGDMAETARAPIG